MDLYFGRSRPFGTRSVQGHGLPGFMHRRARWCAFVRCRLGFRRPRGGDLGGRRRHRGM